jgi:glycosyltransferase involved in cell wall biosynthesis/peptidoglycan/xylan/chitin deacetylase (PgdA/CDA1 family)
VANKKCINNQQFFNDMNYFQNAEQMSFVSIIITTYNQSRFIADAIDSAIFQSYENVEIIVIDDGSTDNTSVVLKKYPSVIYHYQTNQGLSAARNTGITKATGQFILFLGADDLLYPDGIRLNVQAISNSAETAFVSGSFKYIDVNKIEEESISHAIVGNHFHRLILTNYIGMHGTVLYRKNVIEKYLYDTSLKSCEDYDMYLRISKDHKVLHHTGYVAACRRIGNSKISNIPIMLNAALNVVKTNVSSQLFDTKIKRIYTLSREIKIEIFCNKAKVQLLNNTLKIFSSQWIFTLGLILRYRFKSTIKSILKKIKYKLVSILSLKASGNSQVNNSFGIYVLMYHKIDNPALDPWNLSVSKDNFEAHLKLLQQTKAVINTSELLYFLNENKQLTKNHIYITFDDGYEDNALVAAPLLEKYQIPATFFITNHSLTDNPTFFWWDMLEIIFLHQLTIPSILKIIINQEEVFFNFEEESTLEYIDIETLIWKGKDTYNKRTEAYFTIWKLLIGLTPAEQYNIIEQLKTWSQVDLSIYNSYKIMDLSMLQNLKNNPYIEIGGHTKSHVSLSQVDKNLQEVEIRNNKIELENILQRNLHVFAYPYGRTSSDANRIISENKYAGAFTCVPKPVNYFFDKTMLGRFQVLNYGTNDLIEMLRKAGFIFK